jgi:hypothetical protein
MCPTTGGGIDMQSGSNASFESDYPHVPYT